MRDNLRRCLVILPKMLSTLPSFNHSVFMRNVYRLLKYSTSTTNRHWYWVEFGKAFIIHNVESFSEEILKKEFKLNMIEFIGNLDKEGFELKSIQCAGILFSRVDTYILEEAIIQSWVEGTRNQKSYIQILENHVQILFQQNNVLIQENIELKEKLEQQHENRRPIIDVDSLFTI